MNTPIKNISLIRGYLFKLFVTLVLTLELTNFSMARAKEVPTAREMLDQAQNYYLQGDYDQAILLLNELLQKPQQIDSVTIDSNLAEIYRHLGQYNQAIAHFIWVSIKVLITLK
jgi:tetratricopeptide (TPR) repeat protein